MPFLVHSSRRHPVAWEEVSDGELMAAIGREQEDAFDELIRRKTTPLIQVVMRMVRNREEARDIVQVVFLRAWEKRHRFNDRWSPNTWLYRIAVNLSIDHLRARRTHERASRPLQAHLRGIHGGRPRSLADLEHRDVEAVLERLAAELSEKQRLVFLLAGVEGLPSREVGEILGCRASTVRNHLFAARHKLRRELVRLYPEYAPRRSRSDSGPGADS